MAEAVAIAILAAVELAPVVPEKLEIYPLTFSPNATELNFREKTKPLSRLKKITLSSMRRFSGSLKFSEKETATPILGSTSSTNIKFMSSTN